MNTRSTFTVFSGVMLVAAFLVSGSPVRALQSIEDKEKPVTGKHGSQASRSSRPSNPLPSSGTKSGPEPGAASEAVQEPSPPNGGPYEIISSIEFGVRGIAINGNADKYRSDLNYTPGFRIFDASLMMKSAEGGGLLFDQLMINSFGWGTDPNRYLRVSTEKTSLFKFDANYRRIDYFNNLTNIAAPAPIASSQHTSNTEYRQGDFDLTLWPARQSFRLNLGYSLDRNSGPAVTTARFSGDEFPVLMPTRQSADDYRIGFDSRLWVFDLSFLQGWRFYRDDTTYLIDQPQIGNNTINNTVINTFQRDIPIRGEMPYTRFSLHTFLAKRVDFTGRYVYSSANTDYSMTEVLTGRDSSNNRVVSDTFIVTGSSRRPNAIGDIAATVLVTDQIRISNTFRVQTFRISGGDILNEVLLRTRTTTGGEVPLPPTLVNTMAFRTTNYRRYLNTLEGDVDVNNRLSLHLGYRYTNRHIELRPVDVVVGQPAPEIEAEEFDNRTDTFIAGFRAKPLRFWSLYFDAEIGENDNVFTRTANYDYTNLRIRSILRPTRRLTINASLSTRDNTNPTLTEDLRNFGADINSRIFSASADWTPVDRFNLTGGYTYSHLASETIVRFFLVDRVNAVEALARYLMKDNFAFITTYWEPHPRLKFYGAYRIHNDRGQGDRQSTSTILLSSYPYQFESPEVKLSVKLHRNADWIVGYQYWDYKERFVNNQFYQAHLPYTSLRISFDRGR